MFKDGDVVQLKSGGPLMTIEKVNEKNSYFCVWFDGNSPATKSFHGTSLKIYEEPNLSDNY